MKKKITEKTVDLIEVECDAWLDPENVLEINKVEELIQQAKDEGCTHIEFYINPGWEGDKGSVELSALKIREETDLEHANRLIIEDQKAQDRKDREEKNDIQTLKMLKNKYPEL